MKTLKILGIFFVSILVIVPMRCRKLKIIPSYAAKNMSSNVFFAKRPIDSINATDNNIPFVKLAKTSIDFESKIVTGSLFGMIKKKVLFREGLGSILIDNDFDTNKKFLTPKRIKNPTDLEFPYGDKEPKDSLFSNINYNKLTSAVENVFVENQKPNLKNTRSILVVYKNKIIAEKYAEGFDKNTPLAGWSMTKSLFATLFGVLNKQIGFDLNTPVTSVIDLKDWEKDKRSKITVNHLLKMISGLDWEEDYSKVSDVTQMLFLDKDMTERQIRKKASYEPGTHFLYSSGSSNLLSKILRTQFKTYQEYLDFPYTELIDKIGMNSALIETNRSSNYNASSYGWATTRDWAKLGLLYLHRGNWNGTQIFNESWTDYVSTPSEASNKSYGGHFKSNQCRKFPELPSDMFYADGYYGQRTFIIPSMDLVVVRTGLTTPEAEDDLINEMLSDIVTAFE